MKAPATTKGTRPAETVRTPTRPIATAPASATTARAASVRDDNRVPSGRPCSSSSACAHTPTARKNAPSGAARREGEKNRAGGGAHPPAVQRGRDGRTQRDITQVPGRVGRVQDGDEVA